MPQLEQRDGATISRRPAVLWLRRPSPVAILSLLAIAGAIGLLIWYFNREIASGPAHGTTFDGAPANWSVTRPLQRGRTIRVGSFNIHGGKGPDGVRDLDRVAASLKNLDFIGLNEVHGDSVLYYEEDQAEQLGRKLQLPWLFVPTEQCWSGPHFGSAILSTLPLSQWQRIPLEREKGRAYRNLVLSRVPFEGGTLTVLVTHIDRRLDRAAQLRTVTDLFLSLEEPAIMMGDLNAQRTDVEMRPLLTHPDVQECVGQFAAQDDRVHRIDWIFARGLTCTAAGLVDIGASDHPHVWAELRLP